MGTLKLCRSFNDGKGRYHYCWSITGVQPKMMLSAEIGKKRPLNKDYYSVMNHVILVDRHLTRAYLPDETGRVSVSTDPSHNKHTHTSSTCASY